MEAAHYLIVGDIGGTNCRLELIKLHLSDDKKDIKSTESLQQAKYGT